MNKQIKKPTSIPETTEEKQANLCIKVPLSWRQWWVAHSKLQGVTMTDVIIEALAEKFGVPEEQ